MIQADSILDQISGVAAELKLANLEPQIAACRKLLESRNGIDVAVFGRFKAGKSSFLNHLTRRTVLPIGVVPLTAVITRLRYGERERAEVHFLNGSTQTIPLADIGLYVGENENPNNQKQVASVEVELPELEPLAPLQFVDTPGLGSAFSHNTEAAMNWLPNVGAALVAVSSDAPLSERDLALLEELRRHTPKIGLLLTKADLLTKAQRAEVRDFVTAQLSRSSGQESAHTSKSDNPGIATESDQSQLAAAATKNGELPVFFYSIKPELATMRSELLSELLEPLREHRGEAAGQILRHKVGSLRKQALDYVRVALAAATQAESARQALRERLDEEDRQFDLFRVELEVLTRQWSAKALEQSLARLQPVQRTLQERITRELQTELAQWQMRLPPLLEAWRNWVQSFLDRELSAVSREQRSMFCEPVTMAAAHLTRSVRAFHDRLAGHVQAALGITLSPREFALEVRQADAPPLDVAFAFDAAFTTVGWLIPLTLFRRPVEKVLFRKARYEVEKNLSRLAADWSDRVGVVIGELRQQTEQAARNELKVLARMADQVPSNVPRLREQAAELEAMSPA